MSSPDDLATHDMLRLRSKNHQDATRTDVSTHEKSLTGLSVCLTFVELFDFRRADTPRNPVSLSNASHKATYCMPSAIPMLSRTLLSTEAANCCC